MKKINKLLLVVAIVLFGVSCSQSDDENNLSAIKSPAENIGTLHNDGLDFIFARLQSSGLEDNNSLRNSITAASISSKQVVSLSCEYVQTIPEYKAVIKLVNVDDMASQLDNVRKDLTAKGIENFWSSVLNDNSFKNINLSSSEQKAVAETEQIFLNLSISNLSLKQQYDYIKTNVSKIQSTYEKDLLAKNQGELLSGLIEIINSSNDYWYSLATTTSTPPIDIVPIINLDAAGYLVGWAQIWWTESSSSGYSNSKEAQGRRIGYGLTSALAYSTFGMYRPVLKY
ncbi:MAG: hypothetical protein LBO74_07515 [Candidatus Symbiothrix sp.]|jgi:hypothetical protein|nr:hypothetical protein [Candidatus Symbiothrix sp.]